MLFFFFFKQKTAFELRISDWSSDVCSSDLDQCDRAGCVRRRVEGKSMFEGAISTGAVAPAQQARQRTGQQAVEPAPPRRKIGPARSDPVTPARQQLGQRDERFIELPLQLPPQAARQHRRSPAAGNTTHQRHATPPCPDVKACQRSSRATGYT